MVTTFAAPPPDPLDVEIELDSRINYSMQQNAVPVVKAVRLTNRGTADLTDLAVEISTDPVIATDWSTTIAKIPAGSSCNLAEVDLQLSPQTLAEISERIRGRLTLEVRRGDVLLASRSEQLELLARNEWSGLTSLPEILAAFVLPNHPSVPSILRSAADMLESWTGDPSLSGYQSGSPRRVYHTAAAIYTALQKEGISYINPPASFETEGQRIRLPEQVLAARMATCLDMAVLAAACLEQAGLHPLVTVVDGHAFTGVWLIEECFGESNVEDPLRVRKRVDLHEIVVFDATCATTHVPVSFEQAVVAAKRHLDSPDSFRSAIDIVRARKGGIRPLPESNETAMSTDTHRRSSGELAGSPPSVPAAPDILNTVESTPPTTETATNRLDRWKRKLLDLSLRNRLVNFRPSKTTVPFLCDDIAAFEDALADGAKFQIKPRPSEMGRNDPRDADLFRRHGGDDALSKLVAEEMKSKRLYADLEADELERRLVTIYRTARTALEEGGASALYLAIGFLGWYERPESEKQRIAPLLLLPLELTRKSVREGFSLRLTDDDPRLNVTLLELLKQDHGIEIPGLDPLPQDESGLDVPKIVRIFRETVKNIDRWDVIEEAKLGFFSFSKFLMWRDLSERTGDLTRNAVVDHLVNHPHEEFEPDASFPDADSLDAERAASNTYCPLPADSSQLAAVHAAADGRSFVLEGPPGTGKSQTITNLIAHCLTTGKTVLFVSEKIAALNVVYDRLQRIGIGRHCLELHSHKAQKSQIMRQLGESLQAIQTFDETAWEHETATLERLRKELNDYVSALHRPREVGESVFSATSQLIGLRSYTRVELPLNSPDDVDRERLEQLRDIVAKLQRASESVASFASHPWRITECENWTPTWSDNAQRSVRNLNDFAGKLRNSAGAIASHVGLETEGWSARDLQVMSELTVELANAPAATSAMLTAQDWQEVEDRITAWLKHGRHRDELRPLILERFEEAILELPLDEIDLDLKEASQTWWPKSALKYRRVRKTLKRVSKDGRKPSKNDLAEILLNARSLRDEESRLREASEDARVLLGRHWNDGEGDWDTIDNIREWAGRLRSLAARLADDNFDRAAQLRNQWARLATEGRDLLAPEASIGAALADYRDTHDAFAKSLNATCEMLSCEPDGLLGRSGEESALDGTIKMTQDWLTHWEQLREWTAWQRTRSEAMSNQLGALVEAYEAGEFSCADLPNVFERSFYQWWRSAVLDREPNLAQFFSPEHSRKIEEFRESDDRYMQLAGRLVSAKLAARAPRSNANPLPTSEVGILQREIGKRRRQMPIRKLFSAIPNLLPRLTPCLLMSPMSVAQYLDAGHPQFDVVVFDEASQIPVWDAIGALARGKQAIVVGDPKQLPPTNFFSRAEQDDDEDEDPDVVDDLESILDDCRSAGIREKSLDWHYRSRHESLIAFSNYHYYDNRLLTFPSPVREDLGVALRPIPEGVYDKGKSRTNKAEAQAVVDEVVRRLTHPELARYSLGVVTFSQAQQTLIDDLLDNARLQDQRLDAIMADESRESVFVKNLENVQGDERDVILFSICYGPDQTGRVSMNFGPMNRDGGERRLNVAITRARREVIVFSTLRADQIDLARTRARGVRDLKNFLEYAERGFTAIAEAAVVNPDADFDSPFEKEVHDKLVARGWQAHLQVGCSGYRIDLAVIDPDAPGSYVLGIECDGANYHSAKTARDRDKLREAVLRDLGWEIHRIWSTDWWENPDREIDKLEDAIRTAIAHGSSGRKIDRSDVAVASPFQSDPPAAEPLLDQRVADDALSPRESAFHEDVETESPSPPHSYAPFPTSVLRGDAESFYDPAHASLIESAVQEIVALEGPITAALASRRLAALWGLSRLGSRAQKRAQNAIARARVARTQLGGVETLWPLEAVLEDFRHYRTAGSSPESQRKADEIPIEEIANAAREVLLNLISVPHDDLARETARALGFARTGRLVNERMRLGIQQLVDRGEAQRSQDTIVLTAT